MLICQVKTGEESIPFNSFSLNASFSSSSPNSTTKTPTHNTYQAFTQPIKTEFAQIITGETSTSKVKELVPGLTLYFPRRGVGDDISHVNPVAAINESCQKCNIHMEILENGLIKKSDGKFAHNCVLMIKSKEISTAFAVLKKDAKTLCAANGLDILMETQPILYKSEINHDHVGVIEKGALVKKSYETAAKLDQSNLGNQLLRKMGWTGEGGVGKHGTGISDPVFIDAAEGRKGVGHDPKERAIKRSTVQETLLRFIRDDEEEIRFSAELEAEERAIIHRLCQRYKLKHKSHGKGEDRYLVVSKKNFQGGT